MTAFALKLIALICMTIDHVGAIFDVPFYFRCIGRISFPIFAFMIAEGVHHTKNLKKYMLRLGLFALVSEIPFDIAFNSSQAISLKSFYTNTNVFYTLFLGVAAIYFFSKPNTNKYLSASFVILFAAIANLLQTDYAAIGVSMIFLMYILRTTSLKITALSVCLLIIYVQPIFSTIIEMLAEGSFTVKPHVLQSFMLYGSSMFSAILILLYNGKQGFKLKWLFYLFYPAHLIILAVMYKAI